MPVKEIRALDLLEMPSGSEAGEVVAGPSSQWTADAYCAVAAPPPAPTVTAAEETHPGPSQLKRQAAMRREGGSPELKPRPQSRSHSSKVSSPLHRESAVSQAPSGPGPYTSSSMLGPTPSDGCVAPRGGAYRIRDGSISRNRAPRLALSFRDDVDAIVRDKRLSSLYGEDPRTPRPRDAHAGSPASAASSSESEDDRQLLTPLDEPDSIGLDAAAALPPPLSASQAVSTPPDSLPAARVGMRLGVGNIGASIDMDQLGLGLDSRRGLTQNTPSPRPEDGDDSDASSSKRDPTAAAAASKVHASGGSGQQRAPALSRETLYHQMGTIAGLTPPASSVAATGGFPIEVDSVVSNGLEMGLGVNLAASALLNHIPGATPGIAGLTEPRYQRPTGGSYDNGFLEHAGGVRDALYGRQPGARDQQRATAMTAASTQHDVSDVNSTMGGPSGSGEASPVSQAVMDSAEGDLHRRRTTGWMEANGRRHAVPMRQGRHHRADTHDPVIAHARSQLLQQQHEKQQHHQNNYISLRNSPAIATHDLPLSYMLDMPLSAETSLGRNSSLSGCSSGRTRASVGGDSTIPKTPSSGDRAVLSPDAHAHTDGINPFQLGAAGGLRAGFAYDNQARDHHQLLLDGQTAGPPNGALMGLGAGGHFAPGVRAKVAGVLPRLIAGIPLSGSGGETVTIAEYGCLNTRSMQLMQPIISWFAEKAHQASSSAAAATSGAGAAGGYFDTAEASATPSVRSSTATTAAMGASPPQTDVPCRVNFSIIHEDSPQADFRPVAQTLNTSSDSYLNNHWQATHEPSLQSAIFQSFASRPFASRIVPPSTVHLGISLMDLHWSHTPRNPAISQATSAHAELTTFLTARAHEFRQGGVFLMAYIARSEEGSTMSLPGRPRSTISCGSRKQRESLGPTTFGGSSGGSGEEGDLPSSSPVVTDLSESMAASSVSGTPRERRRSNSTPNRPTVVTPSTGGSSGGGSGSSALAPRRSDDIWTTLTDTLAPCLQRLVSCGMLKSDVARHLLTLPMHPRTPKQTQNVLRSVKHLWSVEWSCGLDEALPPADDHTPTECGELRSEAEPLRLPHPACKALQAGTLSRVAFAEHMIQLFKNLYEAHFRVTLREKGRLSKGAVEFVLDSLWDVLQSRIDDQEPCPIAQCELEVQVVALRRL